MSSLLIDVASSLVRIEQARNRRQLTGEKWLELFALLGLSRLDPEQPERFVAAQELYRLGSWAQGKYSSLGKQVARKLRELEKRGLSVVECRGRTKAWRLSMPAEAIVWKPSVTVCRRWIEERQLLDEYDRSLSSESLIPWFTKVTHAIIAQHKGRLADSLELLSEAGRHMRHSIVLGSVSEFLEMTLHSRLGRDLSRGEYLPICPGTLGVALRERAAISRGLVARFDHPDEGIRNLRWVAKRLHGCPDINALGSAYNALGVLARRNKQLGIAEQYLRSAVIYFIASSDLPHLQAALFNLGHTRYQIARARRRMNRDEMRDALSLVELDRAIARSLQIGNDSAQAEIVAGTINLRLGDATRARAWYEAGIEINKGVTNDYDSAGLARLAARIEWAESQRDHQLGREQRLAILERLREARDLFGSAGEIPVMIENEIRAVEAGKDLLTASDSLPEEDDA